MQQACAQQDRRYFASFRRVVFQKGEGALGVTILLQQQGLAENQLAVVRVALQQAIEAFHQAVAGFLVGIGSGQGQEVEVGVALAQQDLLHIHHGVVVASGPGQLHGSGALRFEVVRGILGPDQRGIQRGLVGAQVFGNAKCPLGDPRVLGIDGLGHVVVQRNVEAIALACQFGAQQAEDGFFAERAVDLGFFRYLHAVFDRRRTVRRNGGHGLAAAEQGKSEEQRGRSIHIGRGRLTCGQIIMTQAFGQT